MGGSFREIGESAVILASAFWPIAENEGLGTSNFSWSGSDVYSGLDCDCPGFDPV
jgi:hypothetical protein